VLTPLGTIAGLLGASSRLDNFADSSRFNWYGTDYRRSSALFYRQASGAPRKHRQPKHNE